MRRTDDAIAKLQERPTLPAREGSRPVLGGELPRNGLRRELHESASQHNYGGKSIKIDLKLLHQQRLLGPINEARRLADEYRTIKRPLLRNALSKHEPVVSRRNLWMITSALAGEGKTFTCLNLSLSVARERDWSVVLVDADCSKQHITKLFGASEEPGFIDLLRDSSLSFDSLVMPTNIPGISVLPAGKHDDHAAELLTSARMAALCDELESSDPQRIILFDSPPLLLTAEAAVLATQVGQIVLVVLANETPQQAVLEARDRLDPALPIGLLLNQVDSRDSASAYGEYYTYGATE